MHSAPIVGALGFHRRTEYPLDSAEALAKGSPLFQLPRPQQSLKQTLYRTLLLKRSYQQSVTSEDLFVWEGMNLLNLGRTRSGSGPIYETGFQNCEFEKNSYSLRLTLSVAVFSTGLLLAKYESFYGNVTIAYNCSNYEKEFQYKRLTLTPLCATCVSVSLGAVSRKANPARFSFTQSRRKTRSETKTRWNRFETASKRHGTHKRIIKGIKQFY